MNRPYTLNAAGANRRTYQVIDDLTSQFAVLVTGRVLAAEDNSPLAVFNVACSRSDLLVKVLTGGYFCLAGAAAQLFPLLDSQPYSFDIAISAARRRRQTHTITVPSGAHFPLLQADTALIAEPVRLAGRMTRNSSGAPAAAASLIWDEANTLTLRTPLHFDHAAGQTVTPCTVTPDGVARTLTAPAPSGAVALHLDVRSGLAAGSYLRLGDEAVYEYVRIAAAPANPGLPGEVTLSTPLLHSVASGAAAAAVAVAALAPVRALSEERLAGEALLRLSGGVGAGHVEIGGAGPDETELHALGALSNAQGYYHLDGVSRLRSALFAAAAGGDEAAVEWLIDYRRPLNSLDFRLRPP